jgi:2'-hydroxyisoflavone reductase
VKLLVIGGSVFLGRAYVEEALARGHEVTTFNRGSSNPDLYGDEVEQLHGDRERDLSALEGRVWDAVVDTCGYTPDVVGRSVALLRKAVGHYGFVSSVSVYADRLRSPVDESSAVKTDERQDEGDGGYGRRKAECERVVDAAFGDRALILRPGVIVGPREDVGRLPYWLTAAATTDPVLAPAPPDRTIQLIDARDIAAFGLGHAELERGGVFNVTAPEGDQTFRDLVTECLDVTGSDADVTWVDDARLGAAGVETWTELPLWAPVEYAGAWAVDVTRAQEAGLTCRPLERTVADTWEWLRGVPDYRPRFSWLTPEKAARLMA